MLLAALSAVVLMAPGSAAAQQGFSFKEEKLVAKIQKPEIQILITKQNLNPKYDLDLRESFLPKIVDSIDAKPF
jgi:hypothetical protein